MPHLPTSTQCPPDVILRRSFTRPPTALVDWRPGNEATSCPRGMHLASFPGQSLPLLSRESLGTRLACIYVYVSFHLLQYSGWQRCMCHYKEVSAIREAIDECRFTSWGQALDLCLLHLCVKYRSGRATSSHHHLCWKIKEAAFPQGKGLLYIANLPFGIRIYSKTLTVIQFRMTA